MRYVLGLTLTGLTLTGAAAPAGAASVDLAVTIPQLKVAEYHKPYVAVWIEAVGAPATKNLAIWYDDDKKDNAGTKWLRDVRSWWRKAGRTMTFPAPGITGATRAPGPQKASFTPAQVGALAPGKYLLQVEAAREGGGRELVSLPFTWTGKAPASVKAAGKTELGAVAATIKP